MAPPVKYNATLLERIDLTGKLAIFRVRPDATWGKRKDGTIPDFEPGQYVSLGLNDPADPIDGGVIRPYSIASPPEQKDHLEFYIRYVTHPQSPAPMTHLLWRLKPGDRLHLGRRIIGDFTMGRTLGPDDPRLKVFVAAGTGLAPFASILLSIVRQGLSVDKFAVLHGASIPQDLGYQEDLMALFRDAPQRYTPTISRPKLAPDWPGEKGRVETFFDDEKLSVIEGRLDLGEGELTPDNAVIFICGLYGTIKNTLARLLRRGFVPNDFLINRALGLLKEPPSLFFEQYDNEPILDIQNKEAVQKLIARLPEKP